MPSLKERLKEILITNGLLTQAQLDEALRAQHVKGGSLQQVLIELGYVSEQDLVSALGQGLNIPHIRLARCRVDAEVTRLLSREIAHHYQLLPISKMGETLTVAMVDPLNVFAIDAIARLTGFAINPIIATSKEIQHAIDQYYGALTNKHLDELVQDIQRTKATRQAEHEAEGEEAAALNFSAEAPVSKIADLLLTNAVHRHASDLLVEPMESRLRIRYRIDGILHEVDGPPKHIQSALVSRLKVIGGLNIAEHRLPQDGRFLLTVNNRQVDFRVSVIPSTFGEKIALRILDRQSVVLDMHRLGFAEHDIQQLTKASQRPYGLILACGPTGSGKTTTLYTVLKLIQSPDKNLVTVEDPIEFQLPGINQVAVNTEIEMTFGVALRSILRQDPDIIMVGEIRDGETADMAVKSALTGHLVLSTLHTTSAAGAITRLINMGVEPFLLSATLAASIGQRLVRKLCLRCRTHKTLSDDVSARLRVTHDAGQPVVVQQKGAGCASCFQTGYSGREVIAETLLATPEIREAIGKQARAHTLESLARQQGMQTMREHALHKLLNGSTSVEEVVRNTMGEQAEAER